jgi:hypothetical protein
MFLGPFSFRKLITEVFLYKIIFFAPVNEAERVKIAMFLAGAGKVGHYDQCSFETIGMGQFRPLKGAQPYLGDVGKLELVSEKKIEMVCSEECLKEVIKALKKNHPYEMPAFEIIKLTDFFE